MNRIQAAAVLSVLLFLTSSVSSSQAPSSLQQNFTQERQLESMTNQTLSLGYSYSNYYYNSYSDYRDYSYENDYYDDGYDCSCRINGRCAPMKECKRILGFVFFIIGAVVFIAIVLCCMCCICCRRKQRAIRLQQTQEPLLMNNHNNNAYA